jgi:hypothetical protein
VHFDRRRRCCPAEEAAFEDVLAHPVLAIDPPREVHQELLEDLLQEREVAFAAVLLVLVVDEPGRPRVHGRIDVAEVPLVGGDLAVRMHVLLFQDQEQLALREVPVDHVQGDHVEGQVPGGVPGIFPLVGHRDDVRVHHVRPLGVADAGAA